MTTIQSAVLVIVAVSLALGGCMSYGPASDAAVEKLRMRLISENFDEIYSNTSGVTKAQLTRDEFVERIKEVSSELKSIDPEIHWQRSSHTADEAVFRDDNFSWMHLEKDGRQLDVQLDWAPDFRLCAMSTFTDINGSGKRIFRNCD